MGDAGHEKSVENEIKRLESFIDCSGLGTWEWSARTGEVYINERWAKIIGYEWAELQPLYLDTLLSLIHPDDLLKADEMFKRQYSNTSHGYDYEARLKHKDGSWIWIQCRIKVKEWGEDGQPIWIVGTHTDISSHKQTEDNLKGAQEVLVNDRYRNLLENAPFPVIIARVRDGSLRYGNLRAKAQFGFVGNEGVGLPTADFYDNPDERDLFMANLKRHGVVYDQELCLLDFRKKPYWALISASFTDFEGEPAVIVTINDITSRKIAENELRAGEEKYRMIAENTGDTIWIYNLDQQKFSYYSPSIRELLGYSVEEAEHLSLKEFLPPQTYREALQAIPNHVLKLKNDPQSKETYISEMQHLCKDGTIIWAEVSRRYYYNSKNEIEIIGVSRNVSERKKKEGEILFVSQHDPLTGLLNRNALRKAYGEEAEHQKGKSVIFINIDNFRLINDALGHREGDHVLVEMASKIAECVGSDGMVYRYGGDEFVIVVESNDYDFVQKLSTWVFKSLSSQIIINKQLFYLTTSQGICFGKAGEDIEQTIKNADTALYISKREKNKITVYVPVMDQTRTREAVLERDMKRALEKGEFELHYQPIYNVSSGVVDQAEALLRWSHPELGRVSPAEFVPIAEKSKLIIPITDWAIQETCRKIKAWEARGIQEMTVSINLSLLSFENRGAELADFILSTIRDAEINPSKIKFEITESTLMRDTDEIIKVFNELKNFGVRLALDDFGTGYSSFGSMKDLPIDIVKLDRSLISNVVEDDREQMIVNSMITIIHGLGIEVVAEGVETEAQLDMLKRYDCDYIQGFYFSRPIPADEFVKYYFAMGSSKQIAYAANAKLPPATIHIDWRKGWESGNELTDRQHQDLLRYANRIINDSLEGAPKQILLKQLNLLFDLIVRHFEDEENLLLELYCPEYEAQVKSHQLLVSKMLTLKDAYIRDEIEPAAFFFFVMDDVILGHMIREDSKFFPYTRQ